MTAPELKYGRRNVAKMIREWDALRRAIRAEGTPEIQSALDQVDEHIDYAYRADIAAVQPTQEKPEYCDICRGRIFAETSDGKWWCCVECKSLWLRAAVQLAQVRLKPDMDVIDRSGIDRLILSLRRRHGSDIDHQAADLIHSLTEALAEAHIFAALEPQPDPRDEVIARLVEALEGWVNIACHCNITDGSCCCGDDMENHAEPMNCGHVPVDHGSYIADGMLKTTRAALAAAKAVQR